MKRIVVFNMALALALAAGAAQAVFEGRLVDSETGAARTNATLMATPKFFAAETGGAELGSLPQVEVVTDARGDFSFYSGEWDNPDDLDNVWLGAVIDGVEIVPRKRIVSVPYAIHARKTEKVSGEGQANVRKLTLASSARGMADSLVVSNQVVWGENNLVVGHEISGVGTIRLPDLHLDPSRYFSGMSRFVWRSAASDNRKGDLLREKRELALFSGEALRWQESVDLGDFITWEKTIPKEPSYSYGSRDGVPADGLLTVQFKYDAARTLPGSQGGYGVYVRVCIYHRGSRFGYSDNTAVYFLGSSTTGSGTWFSIEELNGLFLTFPIPKDYIAFIGVSPNYNMRSEARKGAVGRLQFAGALYPFHAVEK